MSAWDHAEYLAELALSWSAVDRRHEAAHHQNRPGRLLDTGNCRTP
jgi:hypothetical protein